MDVENTFYFTYDVLPSEEELESFCTVVAAYWEETCKPLLPNGWIGREVYAKDLSAPISIQAVSTDLAGVAGTATGETMAANNTCAVARRTGLTGRSARGRIFWMGLSIEMVSGNFVDTAFRAGMAGAMNGLDTEALIAGFTPCVVSRYQAGVELTTPLTYPLSGWAVVTSRVASRRKRLPD